MQPYQDIHEYSPEQVESKSNQRPTITIKDESNTWKNKLSIWFLHASSWKFEGLPLAFLPSQELQEVLCTQTYKFIFYLIGKREPNMQSTKPNYKDIIMHIIWWLFKISQIRTKQYCQSWIIENSSLLEFCYAMCYITTIWQHYVLNSKSRNNKDLFKFRSSIEL